MGGRAKPLVAHDLQGLKKSNEGLCGQEGGRQAVFAARAHSSSNTLLLQSKICRRPEVFMIPRTDQQLISLLRNIYISL